MVVDIPKSLSHFICTATNAKSIEKIESVQELWSGYGNILRCHLVGGDASTVILKWVTPPVKINHPRGWNSSISKQRKTHSYKVEDYWYAHWSIHCDEHCRVPKYIESDSNENQSVILLEDLDTAGFNFRFDTLTRVGMEACLRWLAAFHAKFLNEVPKGLWNVGSYWNLETRMEEYDSMSSSVLKNKAHEIDAKLNAARYKTVIHGDAKIANFCFSQNQNQVSSLDFQYVGGGVGVKDLAYFLGSCLNNEELFTYHSSYLDCYFKYLRKFSKTKLGEAEFSHLELEWRELYSVSIADFTRFLEGWKPGHWKINEYTKSQVKLALQSL